ncbi:class I SAM-dependent methyltransferase [Actinoplanes bogorensis]|uniref:Class I SAM-dependent methyltransferase n=1 Tax=Paractinoplanes bogorensis TaxID=1610840 RepID=A0ABS5YXQ5_9ACTN|nr:class I SAM-dependent methyltransferase [Actinoplanes bogorensis]MBU2668215.1 class I SAM-dependent methyltransferase [Actinoplanes bogorensis]
MTDKNTYDGAARWNGPSGNAWIEAQSVMDALYQPLADVLIDAVPRTATTVLDVGCGTGGTTVTMAGRGAARTTGVDISEPMLTAARKRAEQAGVDVTFIRADAQEHEFEPASYDLVMSRFGVMFFNDPVRAFTNLRHAAAPGATLKALVWRDIEDNPFMTTAERAAAPLLPDLPPRDPEAPGQFAFADQGKVRRILDESGWSGVTLEPVDVTCTMPESELVGYFSRLGPVGLALPHVDEATRAKVVDVVRPAFDPYVKEREVAFTAACWMVAGRAA